MVFGGEREAAFVRHLEAVGAHVSARHAGLVVEERRVGNLCGGSLMTWIVFDVSRAAKFSRPCAASKWTPSSADRDTVR